MIRKRECSGLTVRTSQFGQAAITPPPLANSRRRVGVRVLGGGRATGSDMPNESLTDPELNGPRRNDVPGWQFTAPGRRIY